VTTLIKKHSRGELREWERRADNRRLFRHALNVFDTRVDELVEIVPAVKWTDEVPTVADGVVR
jgi:hypothetical protein